MKIVVCCRWIIDEDSLGVRSTGDLDLSRATVKLGDGDRIAIAAAVRLADETDEVVALTFGSPGSGSLMRDALAQGAQAAVCIVDESAPGADGAVTAAVLAAAVGGLDDVGVVVCAEAAADDMGYQVGPRMATHLGLPLLSSLDAVTRHGDRIEGRRDQRAGVTLCAQLPVLITMRPGAVDAPIPGLRAVLAAGRAPVVEEPLTSLGLGPAALAQRATRVEDRVRPSGRKRIVISSGDTHARVVQLVAALVDEGVLE